MFQYGDDYDRGDNTVGPKLLKYDQYAWAVLFKNSCMEDICIREIDKPVTSNAKSSSTFVELSFKYDGIPESRDATRLMTEQSRGAETDEVKVGEAKEEGEVEEEEEGNGEGAVEELEEGEVEEGEVDEDDEEDVPPMPDQFGLARLFIKSNDFKDVSSPFCEIFRLVPQGMADYNVVTSARGDHCVHKKYIKKKPWCWQWPVTCNFLRGMDNYTPQLNRAEMERRFALPLDTWIKDFGSKRGPSFTAQPQEDGTVRWLLQSKSYVLDERL